MPLLGGAPINEEVNETSKENKEAVNDSPDDFKNERLNAPYHEEKTITISLVNSNSYYRQANERTLLERNEYIGSCVASSRALTANKEEMVAYFPNLIGVSPSNERFVTRCKEWLNNIQIKVNSLGIKINVGYNYYHYADYKRIADKIEAVEKEFEAAPKINDDMIEKAINVMVNKLNAIEGEKYRYGYPDNVADYLLYRHCLLYRDIAKHPAQVGYKKNLVRFIFTDDQKIKAREAKLRQEITNAKRNFVAVVGNDKLFDDVYVQYCVLKGLPLLASMSEDRIEREKRLDSFSASEPVKFNHIVNDSSIKTKSEIERFIAYGILVRHPYSQNIVTPEGDFIGANMKEAIAFFKNPDNESVIAAFRNKLKNM